MWLRKAQGGVTQTWKGASYHWKQDGDVTEVPDDLGAQLLHIQGGGFTEAEAPPKKPRGKTPAKDTGEPDKGGDGDSGDDGEGG